MAQATQPLHRRAARRVTGRLPAPVRRAFSEFVELEVGGGVVLLLATLLALAWANSPWAGSYEALWETELAFELGGFTLTEPLRLWINDGLMAVFFFVVGLEIKRELLVGELSSVRQAALPVAAAAGGMAVPAALYTLLNAGGPGAPGWGIPVATDIAFALGVLALLGGRAPVGLKVFVTALAVADDLGAVLVIALFYTPAVDWVFLAGAAVVLAVLVAANRLGVRQPLVYGLLGLALWLAVFESHVHATVAGVLLATTIPVRTRITPQAFLDDSERFQREFAQASAPGTPLEQSALMNGGQQAAIQGLESACEAVQAPLQRLEHLLHPWVAYAIVPLFALANAGVRLGEGAALSSPIALGVFVGLVVGKQVGITLAAWLVVKSGLGALPEGVTWWHVYGAAWLAGIGFTMSLFVAGLAFADPILVDQAKVGILAASAVAGAMGWVVLRRTGALVATAGRPDP